MYTTKEEKLAFEYGKTFNISNVPQGYKTAPCFDIRMRGLVSETITEKGIKRNIRNMKAWYDGVNSQ